MSAAPKHAPEVRAAHLARYESVPAEVDRYVYRIKPTGAGSAKFGPCEVCDKPAEAMFMQVEGLTYDDDGEIDVTHYECRDLFGHRDCLLRSRRVAKVGVATGGAR